jgi:hypothetical protein
VKAALYHQVLNLKIHLISPTILVQIKEVLQTRKVSLVEIIDETEASCVFSHLQFLGNFVFAL